MKPGPLFYIAVPENDQGYTGPYDLVQMADFLRKKIISSETMTFCEGEAEWVPFGDRAQYIIAVEMPPDAVSMRLDALQEQEVAKRGPIPMPSVATMIKWGAIAVVVLLFGAVAYFVAAADTTTGICIAIACGGMALVGQALIFVKLLEEDWITRLLVIFVPFFDIYYFTANLDKYLPYFCAKYIGGILALAAFAGIASVDPVTAEQLQSVVGHPGL